MGVQGLAPPGRRRPRAGGGPEQAAVVGALRRLPKVNTEALLTAEQGQNLKLLLQRAGSGRRPWPSGPADRQRSSTGWAIPTATHRSHPVGSAA